MSDLGKRRPTVVAEAHIGRVDINRVAGGYRVMTPGVEVKVEFSHGDHERALEMLSALVDSVKAQIADVAEGSGS